MKLQFTKVFLTVAKQIFKKQLDHLVSEVLIVLYRSMAKHRVPFV